ncbi:MAG: hypothetical protein COA75_10200 [Cellvibrionales bacterium]|nr:MAG: hypothetical protein COA75_10200 [Cellvibrionales bacterium]
MKLPAYLIIIVTAIVTIVIGLKAASSPIAISALGFIGWAVSPYVYLAVMVKILSNRTSINAVFMMSILVGGFGVWMLADAMFIHVDAQGGLVFILVPLWQWVALFVATLPVYFLNKVNK